MKQSALILFLVQACFTLTSAATLDVGTAAPFKFIRSAIVAAMPYDTIRVSPGMYREGNIIIDKPLVMTGVGFPVLDGQLKFEVVSIKASHVVFEGFRVENSGVSTLDDPGGIKVYDSRHVTIRNNVLRNNFFGIYLQYSAQCIIRGNSIAATATEEQQIGNGIHCWKSDSHQIVANEVSGHRDGIYFEFVTNSVIWRNIAWGNIRYGLHFMFSNQDAYFSNVFTNNGAGVAVMFTRNVTMMNNTFRENWGDAAYGLLLKEISDSFIMGNKFYRNTSGIFMEGTNRIVVERNSFDANGWAMKIQASCMDNNIRNNNFTGNTFDISTNGTLVLNKFDGNYWDKYEGYDLDRDAVGDIPYHPISLFSMIVEMNPPAMLLYRSFLVTLLDRSEKLLPSLTPDAFRDDAPVMKAFDL
jgi:nitrous oxidase accessory protein